MPPPDARLPVEAAYARCLALARSHYENFPVASRLLPGRLRRPVAAIYAFARRADDLADEGDHAPEERLARLDDMEQALVECAMGQPSEDFVFIALGDAIRCHALPVRLFQDLLSAFRQDVEKRRYRDFDEVLDYCRRSANPVGRLLLHLMNRATPDNLECSDAICTALQLVNFLQDIRQDLLENDRIYIPETEMEASGVTETDLREGRDTPALRALLDEQISRARALLRRGAPLGHALPGRLGLEIRLVIAGGERVLERLEAAPPLSRLRLRRRDWMLTAWRALRPENVGRIRREAP